MQIILLFLYPIFNSILNRWPRGTYSWGPFATAAVLAVLIFLITWNYFAAVAFFVAYVAGESFGWGKWLGAIPFAHDKTITQEMYNSGQVKTPAGAPLIERDDGKNNGVHLLANLLCKETKDFRGYGWWALMFRGLLWALPIYIALSALGAISVFFAPFAVILLAIAFPICYNLTFKLFGDSYWTMGELLYGLVQGIIMAVGLSFGVLL